MVSRPLTVRRDVDGKLEELSVPYPADVISARRVSDVHCLVASENLKKIRGGELGTVRWRAYDLGTVSPVSFCTIPMRYAKIV